MKRSGGGLIVVKAQVHAGGRGKGVAIGPEDNRERGAGDRQRQEAPARGHGQGRATGQVGRRGREGRAQACWARRWSRIRPARQGSPISKVLVTVGHNIARELYLGLAIDREPQVPGADGLDRGRRRDRDRCRTRPPRRSSASRSTLASAWPISRRARSARPWGSSGQLGQEGRSVSRRTSSSSSSTRMPRWPRSIR